MDKLISQLQTGKGNKEQGNKFVKEGFKVLGHSGSKVFMFSFLPSLPVIQSEPFRYSSTVRFVSQDYSVIVVQNDAKDENVTNLVPKCPCP